MTACATPDCGRPVRDATICGNCTADLERNLGDVAAYADELDTTLSRQTATGGRVGGRSADKPLPYDPPASSAIDVMRSTLVGWVRALEVAEVHGPVHRDCLHPSCSSIRRTRYPVDTLADQARYLLSNLNALRQHEAADEALDEIGSAVDNARRAVDRRADRIYAGPCMAPVPIEGDAPHEPTGECRESLFASPKRQDVTCRSCGALFDVEDRRDWLRQAADSHLGTAAEISALCRHMLGEMVTASMIRGYAHRGQILAHGQTPDPRGREVPMYRVGEVLSAAARAASDPRSRRDARKAAREASEQHDGDAA